MPAAQFFTGVFQTAVGPGEMLTEIRVPSLGGAGWAYLKFSRRAQDWATVGVAAVASNGGARVGLVSMGATLAFVYLRLLGRTSVFPVRDPRVIESINYQN